MVFVTTLIFSFKENMSALKKVAMCAGAYALCSFIILKLASAKDDWRSKLKERFPYPLTVIAHRGGSLIGPENTMFTFERAINEGSANMLELDVWRSKDGKVVVCHDGSLERTCGEKFTGVSIGDIVVGSSPSDSLPQSARSIKLHFKTTSCDSFVASDDVPVDDKTRLCLLTEVFERFHGVPLHIDIKESGFDTVKQVLDLIEKYKRESITFVGSSDYENQGHIKKYFSIAGKEKRSRYRVFPGAPGVIKTYLCYYTGILPFMSLDFDVFSIPAFTKSMRDGAKSEAGGVIGTIATSVFTSPSLWKYLQKRGIAVIGWVANEDVDFKEASNWPLNGVMSDDPIKLKEYFSEHGTGNMIILA